MATAPRPLRMRARNTGSTSAGTWASKVCRPSRAVCMRPERYSIWASRNRIWGALRSSSGAAWIKRSAVGKSSLSRAASVLCCNSVSDNVASWTAGRLRPSRASSWSLASEVAAMTSLFSVVTSRCPPSAVRRLSCTRQPRAVCLARGTIRRLAPVASRNACVLPVSPLRVRVKATTLSLGTTGWPPLLRRLAIRSINPRRNQAHCGSASTSRGNTAARLAGCAAAISLSGAGDIPPSVKTRLLRSAIKLISAAAMTVAANMAKATWRRRCRIGSKPADALTMGVASWAGTDPSSVFSFVSGPVIADGSDLAVRSAGLSAVGSPMAGRNSATHR